MVVSWKQWSGLTAVFLVTMFFFFYDMLFPKVRIIVFSDTAAADLEAVLREVSGNVTIRPGWPEDAEAWGVSEQPAYLVLAYGYGNELAFDRELSTKDWFLHYRTEDLDELILYLRQDWSLAVWRWRLANSWFP